jgi:hypothetical protein
MKGLSFVHETEMKESAGKIHLLTEQLKNDGAGLYELNKKYKDLIILLEHKSDEVSTTKTELSKSLKNETVLKKELEKSLESYNILASVASQTLKKIETLEINNLELLEDKKILERDMDARSKHYNTDKTLSPKTIMDKIKSKIDMDDNENVPRIRNRGVTEHALELVSPHDIASLSPTFKKFMRLIEVPE